MPILPSWNFGAVRTLDTQGILALTMIASTSQQGGRGPGMCHVSRQTVTLLSSEVVLGESVSESMVDRGEKGPAQDEELRWLGHRPPVPTLHLILLHPPPFQEEKQSLQGLLCDQLPCQPQTIRNFVVSAFCKQPPELTNWWGWQVLIPISVTQWLYSQLWLPPKPPRERSIRQCPSIDKR